MLGVRFPSPAPLLIWSPWRNFKYTQPLTECARVLPPTRISQRHFGIFVGLRHQISLTHRRSGSTSVTDEVWDEEYQGEARLVLRSSGVWAGDGEGYRSRCTFAPLFPGAGCGAVAVGCVCEQEPFCHPCRSPFEIQFAQFPLIGAEIGAFFGNSVGL